MAEWRWRNGLFSSLRLRERAAAALRTYREAEARFHALQQTKDALDSEERVILHIWAVKLSKASLSPEDCEGFQTVYRSLTERRLELFEPWQAANADLVSAHEDAKRLLQEIGPGLREIPNVPVAYTRSTS
ncbi:hypothetical protein [Ensifer sp. ENS12]|uniref:hypothetical protein n=1 Tax=Ensifer sp. ENS12 TaxID=2854774 RepID=UPI001C447D4F|nr:hypothetical protein [Ensifer sp. ENS12]MBV7518899.1 hypothetical protein [Ensifer sp. ENS12]